MWRSSPSRRLLGALLGGPSARPFRWRSSPSPHLFSTTPPRFPSPPPITAAGGGGGADPGGESMTGSEAKKLMRLVNVETLKRRLGMEAGEVIGYKELLEACEGVGLARSRDEAEVYARVLDDAGVVLLFRDKVYLHPDKVVELVRKAVPLALTPEDDPRREEMKQLQEKKKEIDALAHRQVRRILWSGLGFFVFQISLFFRLTFWEFSWDVMEPIAFFSTTAGILIGYAYFLFTSRDPTYQDLMKRLFLLRQRKLAQKQSFDISRFEELQRHCRCPLDHVEESGLDAFQRD